MSLVNAYLPLVPPSPAPIDRARYARNLSVPELAEEGQRRLAAARVCVVGAGGLGSPALLYLAAAGVGTLGIVDADVVDLSNLQRQVLHDEAAIGVDKTASAAARLRALNASVEVIEHPVRLDALNAPAIFADYDLVLDCTDNFATRYVIADTCSALGLPVVWAAVWRTQAQISVFWTAAGWPGLRDLFPSEPDPVANADVVGAGVLGSMVGTVGSMMATETIKLITGAGEPLAGRVRYLDVLANSMIDIPLHPRQPSAGPSQNRG